MRYTYFDYLVENPKFYRQSLVIVVFLLIFSFILLFITSLIPEPNKNLEQSKFVVGETQAIKQIEVKRKGQALLDFNREVDDKVLLLKVNNVEFIIEGQIYLDYYNKFINSISRGDIVKVYYFIDYEGNKIIQQLETNEEILMSIKYTLHRFFVIKVALISSLILFSIVLVILLIKRKRVLNR